MNVSIVVLLGVALAGVAFSTYQLAWWRGWDAANRAHDKGVENWRRWHDAHPNGIYTGEDE